MPTWIQFIALMVILAGIPFWVLWREGNYHTHIVIDENVHEALDTDKYDVEINRLRARNATDNKE